MIKGIDCASKLTADSAAKIKAEGYAFAGRYLVPPEKYRKALTADEAKLITDAGLKLLTVYETTAERAKGGAAAGAADARTAVECALRLKMPKSGAIYFAVDFGAAESDMPAIREYLAAARINLEGYRLGVYGSYAVIEAVADITDCRWQCVGWSYGKKSDRRHVYQAQFNKYAGGVNVDINECADPDAAGLWDYTPAAHWAEKDLEWAVENGLLKGYDESGLDLRPDRPVTRAELAAVLHRYDEMRRT